MPDGHDYLMINDVARHSGWAHGPAVGYADYGAALFALLALATYVWAWWHRNRGALVGAAWAGLAGLVALAVNQLPVHLLDEARPYAVMPAVLVLVPRSADPSAPSDHAVLAAAVATGLWLVRRRLGVLAWVLALLMAFDRVYVGSTTRPTSSSVSWRVRWSRSWARTRRGRCWSSCAPTSRRHRWPRWSNGPQRSAGMTRVAGSEAWRSRATRNTDSSDASRE